MFLPFFEWLNELGMPGANVMEYVTFRAVMAFVFALLVTMLTGGRIIRYLRRKKIGDEPRDLGVDGLESKKGVPTMGGIIIFMSILIPVLLFCRLSNIYVLLLIGTTVVLSCLGFIDDYIKTFKHNKEGLSGRWKIIVQVLLGVFIGATLYFSSDAVIRENTETFSGETVVVNISPDEVKSTKTTIPFIKENNFDYRWIAKPLPVDWQQTVGWIVFVIATILIVTGTSNGANLTDGLDGLTAGISAIIGVGLMILSYVSSHIVFASYLNIMYVPGTEEVFIYTAAFTGACMGFLWYNGFPAKVFMGDTGSLMLGGVIAVIAIILHKEILLILLCGIFLVEALSVILQTGYYKFTKKKGVPMRIFKKTPLHHHFQHNAGEIKSVLDNMPSRKWHEQTIVLRFWLISIILCALAILTLKIR